MGLSLRSSQRPDFRVVSTESAMKIPQLLLRLALLTALVFSGAYWFWQTNDFTGIAGRWQELSKKADDLSALPGRLAALLERLNGAFPKKAARLTSITVPEASLYDLVVVPFDEALNSEASLEAFRKAHPHTLILGEIPVGLISPALGFESDAFAFRDPRTRRTLKAAEATFVNLSTPYSNDQLLSDALAEYYAAQVLNHDFWDGLLLSDLNAAPPFIKVADINGDRVPEQGAALAQLWRAGWREFVRQLRARVGQSFILVGAGDNADSVLDALNGRILEFPTSQSYGAWSQFMSEYLGTQKTARQPAVNLVALSQVNNAGARFGLSSVLLGNGFYYNPNGESQVWYDELTVRIGQAEGLGVTTEALRPDLYERSFENGRAFVNASGQARAIDLRGRGGYALIKGGLDPEFNYGGDIEGIEVAPYSGLVVVAKPSVFNPGSFLTEIFSLFGL